MSKSIKEMILSFLEVDNRITKPTSPAKKENIVKRNGTFDPHFDYSSELHFGASDIKVDETYEVAFKGTRLAYNLSEKTTLTFNDKESKVKDLIKARGMLTTIQSNPANLSKKQIDELSNRLSKINNQLEQLGVVDSSICSENAND